jgi:hypothetical protein
LPDKETLNKKLERIGINSTYAIVNPLHAYLQRTVQNDGYLGRLSLRLKIIKMLIEYGERTDDIYIATYPRSGTTWMQMIMYQLTSDGNMDFNHIYDVSPFPEYSAIFNKPLKNVPSPRIIKTHGTYDEISKRKGRFIYIIRDGMDVVASLYHHRKNYRCLEYRFEDALDSVIKEWFIHVVGWLKNKRGCEILYIRYEDMLSDIETTVRKIMSFFNIKIDEAKIPRIIERSSFEFMKKHKNKFGEQPEQHVKIYDNFIRKGKAGEGHKYFSDSQIKLFKEIFHKHFDGINFMKSYNTQVKGT